MAQFAIRRQAGADFRMKKALLCSFSGIYDSQIFCNGKNETQFEKWDASNIRGTNAYLDSEAKSEIQHAFRQQDFESVHFIDSGNYHYLSKLWTDRICENFDLVVFDHHSDMQEPAFEGILSCGSWIRAVLDENPFLKTLHLIGVKDELAAEIDSKYRPKINLYLESECGNSDFEEKFLSRLRKQPCDSPPVYISVDKDVLPEAEVKTNWDGGSLPFRKLLQILSGIFESRTVIGVDICGEPSVQDKFQNLQNMESNDRINGILTTVLREKF